MRKIILSIIILVVVSGAGMFIYYYLKPGPISDAWKKEVLWAQECGEAGIACCPDREPACSYGLDCCGDPNDPERSICLDSCTCGETGKFCCADEPFCQSGLACSEGFCAPCGEEDQPCCYGEDTCADELVCGNNNTCVLCGLAGNPCCGDGLGCLTQNNFDKSRTECRDGTCIRCGSNGKIACQNEPICNIGNLENNNFCLACGEYNQPCCNEQSGVNYDCDPSENLYCQLGFCIN